MIKKIIKGFALKFAGLKKYQTQFEGLHHLALKGMNIGGGAGTNETGEIVALQYIKKQTEADSDLAIFDVGANAGQYSTLINEIFAGKAKVFAFEPSKKTFQKLKANLGEFTNFQAFNFGFGEKEATLTLFSNEEGSGLASVYKRRLDHFNIQMNNTEEIEIKTVDGFCNGQNIKHIHLLKLDVEGHELKVLQGAGRLLKNGQIDFIQFEFGGCNIDSRTYFQDFYYLLKDDFHIYRIVKDGLQKIEQYKETYEAFLTTNYLAERKRP